MNARIHGTTSANRSALSRLLVIFAVGISSGVAAQVPVTRSIIGNVTSDSAGAHGIGSVELTIRALGVGTRSNWMGEFRLPGVPAGRWLVEVRRVGYRSTSDSVTVTSNADASLNFVLQPAPVTLDSVVTRADAQQYISPNLRGFMERMKSHQGGYFIGDSVLRQNESRQLPTVIETRAPGLNLYRLGNTIYAVSARAGAAPAQCGVFQHCVKTSRKLPEACYVTVYLDGVPQFDPRHLSPTTPPTDLNTINVADLTGVEYYPSPESVPTEYQGTSPCGALLLWTREK
jgi:carboxypeptidase family protein